jgi:hypothetical protein
MDETAKPPWSNAFHSGGLWMARQQPEGSGQGSKQNSVITSSNSVNQLPGLQENSPNRYFENPTLSLSLSIRTLDAGIWNERLPLWFGRFKNQKGNFITSYQRFVHL